MRLALPFALLALLPGLAPAQAPAPFRYPAGRHGDKAELKYINGLPLLVVAGTPEEMGAAVGALALKPGSRVLGYPRDLLRWVKADTSWDFFVNAGRVLFKRFPDPYARELEALVRAARVARDPVIA